MRRILLVLVLALVWAAPAAADGISPGAGLHGIAAGPDGNLWFTESAIDRIGRITPGGAITELGTGISPGARPEEIAAGPDGNLWFTERAVSRIGRITPQGVVTEFGATGLQQPEAITAGPDGNVWFTDPPAGAVGRITPQGAITLFTNGITGGPLPEGITAGPDGNLWFAEEFHARIGRITPQGQVTEFSTGITPNSQPLGIAAGPDGNLWFTEQAAGRVGRITTAGAVTEFADGIPPVAAPGGITAGSDGNLWFTEVAEHDLGRITPAGVVTQVPVPSAERIAAGPDGALWFTEADEHIGRVTPAGALTEFPPRPTSGPPPGPTPTPTAGLGGGSGATPPPVAGVRVQARVLSGRVLVKLPHGAKASALDTGWHAFAAAGFTPLEGSAALPVGTLVDARKGVLAMTAAVTARNRLAAAKLRAGIFRIRQRRAKGRKAVPAELALASRGSTAKACAHKAPRKGVVRSVSVVAKGLYRTIGAAASATATKASFTTQDRCTGTVTRVTKGRVQVHDARRHKTVTVKAGHTYLAKARLFGARKKRRP